MKLQKGCQPSYLEDGLERFKIQGGLCHLAQNTMFQGRDDWELYYVGIGFKNA